MSLRRCFRVFASLALVSALGTTASASAGAAPGAAPGAMHTATPATKTTALPDFATVRARHQPSDLQLLDRHGQPLQLLRVNAQARVGPWLKLEQLSPALRHAIVASEDRRFWQHAGVDWPALAAGAWATAWNQRTRGASTVTMQLAGLLDDDLRRPAQGRGVGQKLGQLVAAQALEARWSKTQILEAYVNLVPLRGELVGLAAATQQLLGKHASGVDVIEAALLAALLRAPNADERAVTRRACELLQSQGHACTGLATTVAQALQRKPAGAEAGGENLAPHFARYWQQAGGGPLTTLDAGVQRLALAALRQQLAELRGREVDDGAVVVIDNASGELRAWVGSATGGAGDVDAVLARRQPGSALKPFVYGLAFEQGLLTPDSLLNDAPLHLLAGSDAYLPQNFDHRWRGWVSAREALASSLNIPAVRVAAMLGPEAMFNGLNRAGLRLRESAGFHGHALALGSAEVTLLDLTNAYRALANGGRASALALPRRANAAKPERLVLFKPEVAAVLSHILSDNAARASSFGFDNPLVTRVAAAVKTGTSKDMRDNWCIGYSARYTVGVWLGNASGAPMRGVSGVVGAAPVWRQLMQALAAPGDEWMQAQLAPKTARARMPTPRAPVMKATQQRAGEFGIHSVAEGSVLAFDPDIPARAQQLRLRGAQGLWLMNGQAIGRGSAVDWPLQMGRHVVELRDGSGQLLDRVRFSVRPGLRLGAPTGLRLGVPASPRPEPSPQAPRPFKAMAQRD